MRLLIIGYFINSLHAVHNLLLSLPLAHKHMYLTSYMFYTVSVWTCLQHISLYELYYTYALYSLYAGLSLAHTQLSYLCIFYLCIIQSLLLKLSLAQIHVYICFL